MKNFIKKIVYAIDKSGRTHEVIKQEQHKLSMICLALSTIFHRIFINMYNRIKNSFKSKRMLEIGPGEKRIEEFETVNIIAGKSVDYVYNASKTLPFKSETFDVVYASHILEHIPWYLVNKALVEWMRIIKQGGVLDVWVPDGLKICKIFTDYEENGIDNTEIDGWYKFNPSKDPCVWAAGRLFTYGDGLGTLTDPNWHRALFSPRYLKEIMEKTGFVDVHELTKKDIRGYDHGWINLGIRGTKPKI